MEIVKKSQKNINKVIDFLNDGGIVICPTDTVYGFLAQATNKKAIDKIYKIKKRPRTKPLPVFAKNIKMAQDLAEINAEQIKILKQKWPGKFTFILKSKKRGTIALRIPKYKFLNDLLKQVNRPLAQTSVNISGQPALTKITDIIEKFGGSDLPILLIDAGNLPKSNSSTIIDLTNNKAKILRK